MSNRETSAERYWSTSVGIASALLKYNDAEHKRLLNKCMHEWMNEFIYIAQIAKAANALSADGVKEETAGHFHFWG